MNENDWTWTLDEESFVKHWAKLNEHLVEVYPIVQAFCDRHGFGFVNRTSIGRYPRVRIDKVEGFIKRWIDLSMELDEQGERFQTFRRDLPYHLGAGAYIDIADGSTYGCRLGKALLCFEGKPFDEVVRILDDEMERCLPTIESWDEDFLKQHGRRTELRGPSKS